MTRLITIYLIISCLWLTQCSGVTQAGDEGSATDVGNAMLSGSLLKLNGEAADETVVFLFRSDYNANQSGFEKLKTDTTDAQGRFVFHNIDIETYNIEAVHLNNKTRLIIPSIAVGLDDTLTLDTDTLRATGFLVVSLNTFEVEVGDYIYIPGTSNFEVISSTHINNNEVLFSEIAEMTVNNVVVVKVNDTLVISDTVQVNSEDSSHVNQLTDWAFNKKLVLNTTGSGANVMSSMEAFPLLVQLTQNNFPFSDAALMGEDLRFTDDRGNLLSREIETWDSANGLAEIWVLVDRIRGNELTELTLWWGNASMSSLTNEEPVFDVTNSFSGVWHMGADILDVSSNKISGILTGASSQAGLLGQGTMYNGAGSFGEVTSIDAQPLKFDTQSFSYSLWVNIDSSVGAFDQPLWNGGTIETSIGYTIMLGTEEWEAKLHDSKRTYIVEFGLEPSFLKRWVYLTAVVDRESNYFIAYLNGVAVDSTSIDTLGSLLNDLSFFIGRDGTPILGLIDEVRVESIARTAEWIKLCYENQRENQTLITYK